MLCTNGISATLLGSPAASSQYYYSSGSDTTSVAAVALDSPSSTEYITRPSGLGQETKDIPKQENDMRNLGEGNDWASRRDTKTLASLQVW